MGTIRTDEVVIPIPWALWWAGILAGVWGIAVVATSTVAYLPEHPEFSVFATYLSDIGDTPGWPQVLFNSGTLIAAPIRLLVLALVALRLFQLGAGRGFVCAVLILGLVSSSGTVLMTAVPFSTAPEVHRAGIPLYFLGIVVLQTVIGIRELSLARVSKLLPAASFLTVLVFLVFATLVTLYERGVVDRSTPVIWEWLAFAASVAWVLAHAILLGRPRWIDTTRTPAAGPPGMRS